MSQNFKNPWKFRSLEACLQELERLELPTTRPQNATTKWCNATFDEVMCWPATPGGQSYSLHCPPMKGMNPNKIVKKLCHLSGQWANRNGTADSERPDGWTGYLDQCLSGDSGMASAKSAEHNCWADFKSGFLFPILLFFLLFLLVVLFIIGITYLGRYCSKTKKLQKKQVPTAAGPSSVVV